MRTPREPHDLLPNLATATLPGHYRFGLVAVSTASQSHVRSVSFALSSNIDVSPTKQAEKVSLHGRVRSQEVGIGSLETSHFDGSSLLVTRQWLLRMASQCSVSTSTVSCMVNGGWPMLRSNLFCGFVRALMGPNALALQSYVACFLRVYLDGLGPISMHGNLVKAKPEQLATYRYIAEVAHIDARVASDFGLNGPLRSGFVQN